MDSLDRRVFDDMNRFFHDLISIVGMALTYDHSFHGMEVDRTGVEIPSYKYGQHEAALPDLP